MAFLYFDICHYQIVANIKIWKSHLNIRESSDKLVDCKPICFMVSLIERKFNLYFCIPFKNKLQISFLFKSATKYTYVTCFSLTIQFSYHFIFCSICYLLKSMYISLHRIMSISSTLFKYRISKPQRQRFTHGS